MTVLNDLHRHHLASDVVVRVPKLESVDAPLKHMVHDNLIEHKFYVRQHGDNLPEMKTWTRSY